LARPIDGFWPYVVWRIDGLDRAAKNIRVIAVMRRSLRATVPLIAAASVIASCGTVGTPGSDPMAGRYVMSTGGGALAQIQALTARFSELHPVVRWSVENVGSDAGVSLVAQGQSDLGGISRDLTTAEKGTVALEPLGVVGTAVAVGADGPVTGLTLAQVRQVFTGEIKNWTALGGPDLPIKVLIREPNTATRQHFDELLFSAVKGTYAKDALTVGNSAEMATSIRSFAGAVGMVTLKPATVDDKRLRLLKIDGVPATIAALNDGTYLIRRPLYLVYPTDKGKMKPAPRAFVEFVQSPEGQRILATF
jgi:phosphate transport system substrate-binding protein